MRIVGEKSRVLGIKNERRIARKYGKQGYQVLIVNEKGFPDLIVLKDKEIKFFVEVKTGKHSVHPFQEKVHKEIEKMGFQVRTERLERRSPQR